MTERTVRIVVTCAVSLMLLYLSQFWTWQWWSRPGLFGWSALRPNGDLIAFWLRGTPYQPFALVVWIVVVFAVLSGLQRLLDRLFDKGDHGES